MYSKWSCAKEARELSVALVILENIYKMQLKIDLKARYYSICPKKIRQLFKLTNKKHL